MHIANDGDEKFRKISERATRMLMETMLERTSDIALTSDDLELVQRAQRNDTAAFGELVSKYRDRIYTLIYRIIQNHDDALEISQRTFVKVWQRIRKFKGKSSFYTWLYRIATFEALEFLRRQRPRHVELDPQLPSPVPHPDRETQRNEVRQYVLDAVAKLTPKHRAVIVLRELENLPYGEIATILQCSIGTVMSRLFHARRDLQTLLRPLYETLL